MSVSNGLQAENVEESEFGSVSSKKSTGELMETRTRSKRSVVKKIENWRNLYQKLAAKL